MCNDGVEAGKSLIAGPPNQAIQRRQVIISTYFLLFFTYFFR